jgi:hypothetical protein
VQRHQSIEDMDRSAMHFPQGIDQRVARGEQDAG